MPRFLVITIGDGDSIQYGYEQGLNAICEALQKELGRDYEKLQLEIIDGNSETLETRSS